MRKQWPLPKPQQQTSHRWVLLCCFDTLFFLNKLLTQALCFPVTVAVLYITCSILMMRQQMTIQRKMTLLSPVLHLLLPFLCCPLRPWRWQAVSSNLKRNNEKRPRSDILFHYMFNTLRTTFILKKKKSQLIYILY